MRAVRPLPRTEVKQAEARDSIIAKPAWLAGKGLWSTTPSDAYDHLTWAVLAALVIVAWFTVRDYAISNDEGVQQHYGELIVVYYRSGFTIRDVFTFDNLYLYGGLFDVISVALGRVIRIDPYELRHILCSMIGIGGIAASAATARSIAGPRAGLIAAIALALCGAWYGSMFNHTKDIPFAAAMAGATLFLCRIARQLPSPRAIDVVAFGCLAGVALGMRSLGLLLIAYLGLAIMIYLPWREGTGARLRVAASATLATCPAVALAYLIMILAWPWAALAPLNPIRGLLAFSEFHYAIRTMLAGRIYEMAKVPRLYIAGYLLIRVPLIELAGAVLGMTLPFWQTGEQDAQRRRRDVALVSSTVIVPVAFQAALHGPAFTGIRHFLFVLPPLATLAGIGFSGLFDTLATRGAWLPSAALVWVFSCFVCEGTTLVRLHPYENLSYNSLVGGLPGAFRRYDLDYWFNSMPEAIRTLEAFVRDKTPIEAMQAPKLYSVAVCGERLAFDQAVTLPQLHWDFRSEWDESEFFIAPTHMNCDRDLDGEIVGTVERLGVPIAYVKDRRAIAKRPVATVANSESCSTVSAAGFAQTEHSAGPTSLGRVNADLPDATAH
jgi:Dolichyl-phosphate-mannose-protein mannosyltransferase